MTCPYCREYHDRPDLARKSVDDEHSFVVVQSTIDCPGWGDGCAPVDEDAGRGVNKRLEWVYRGSYHAREDGRCRPCVDEWNACGVYRLGGSTAEMSEALMPVFAPSVELGPALMFEF